MKKHIDFKTNCKIHGATDAYATGECVLCHQALERQTELQRQHEFILLRKKNANIPPRFFDATFELCVTKKLPSRLQQEVLHSNRQASQGDNYAD